MKVDQMLPRLSQGAAYWVDGGSVDRWRPVYGRLAKPVALPGQQGRFVFTRTASRPVESTLRRWMDHQRLLVEAPDVASPSLVFWRLAVRQRAFAMDVRPRADLKEASDRVRRLAQRVATLQVTLGFFTGESVPCWVVCDEGVPVMVGLPQYHLVQTDDAGPSLGSLLSTARLKPQVHEVTVGP